MSICNKQLWCILSREHEGECVAAQCADMTKFSLCTGCNERFVLGNKYDGLCAYCYEKAVFKNWGEKQCE